MVSAMQMEQEKYYSVVPMGNCVWKCCYAGDGTACAYGRSTAGTDKMEIVME